MVDLARKEANGEPSLACWIEVVGRFRSMLRCRSVPRVVPPRRSDIERVSTIQDAGLGCPGEPALRGHRGLSPRARQGMFVESASPGATARIPVAQAMTLMALLLDSSTTS
ncbi:hypothetical protein ACFS3C_16850 [Azotobacter vinelandii]|uniref:hypothetical protein n=1 Tax=Azotobacter TaxID=352 RepID=UPI001114AA2F|nr:hypothetical protein [Azotobacter vinelandii]